MVTVSFVPSTGWLVKLTPTHQPFVFPNKGQAVAFVLSWAERNQPCELEVYAAAGTLERRMKMPSEHYRRGSGSDRRQRQVHIPFPDRREQDRRLNT